MKNINPIFPYVVHGKESFLTSTYGNEIGDQYQEIIQDTGIPVTCGGIEEIPYLQRLAKKRGYKILAEGLNNYISYLRDKLNNLPTVDNLEVIYH